ncbi:hypothetical protein [Lysobacter sp. CA199]|uniref:hypothetical protein n=1 Tax=Lysobacter sp. CA199 TaxID=3455608 RepID=UPI003F8D46F7
MRMRLIGVLALGLLGGCQMTVFRAPPAAEAASCDPRLIGTWNQSEWGLYGAEYQGPDDHEDTVRVDARCRVTDGEKQTPEELDGITLSFVSMDGSDYVVAEQDFTGFKADDDDEHSDDAAADKAHSDPADRALRKALPKRGYTIYRYKVAGDRVEFYSMMHQRISVLIARKSIAGLTARSWAHSEYSDFEAAQPLIRKQLAENIDAPDYELRVDDDEDAPTDLFNLIEASPQQVRQWLRSQPKLFYSSPMLILVRANTSNKPAKPRTATPAKRKTAGR